METYDKTPTLLLEYIDSPIASSNMPVESSLISITNETFSNFCSFSFGRTRHIPSVVEWRCNWSRGSTCFSMRRVRNLHC